MEEKLKEFLKVDNGYGSGSGAGYGSGDGAGYGDGYGDGIANMNGVHICDIDGVETGITQIKENVAIGFILIGDLTTKRCYVVKQNNMFAHGYTLHEAMENMQEKLFDDMSEEERIESFVSEFTTIETEVSCKDLYSWHHKLTGSCAPGRDSFVKNHEIDVENGKLTVKQFIDLTKNDYCGHIIKNLEKRYTNGKTND